MRLIDLIPDSKTVSELPPEELAAVVLRHLNERAVTDNRRDNPPFFHIGNYCNGESDVYRTAGQAACNYALAVAWEYLVTTGMLAYNPAQTNDWYFLTPRARSIKSAEDLEHYKKASLYPPQTIHPAVREQTYQEFLRGDYETAVFKAFKLIEATVTEKGGFSDKVLGVDLMKQAFRESGPLTDRTEVVGEQEALMALYWGVIGRFKNPTSHRFVNYNDPAVAVEILGLASLLMRILDQRT